MHRTSPNPRPRRRWYFALVLGASLLVGAAAGAQPPGAPPTGASPSAGAAARGRAPRFSPEAIDAHVRTLTERVRLNARQQREVRQILDTAAQEARALREPDARRSPEAHRARRDLVNRVEDQIWGLLTCEQKDAFRLLQREMHSRRLDARPGHRGRGHGHGPGQGRGHGPGQGRGHGPGAEAAPASPQPTGGASR